MRHDRDLYVKVLRENIMDKYQRSFDMRSANHFTTSNTPFDFDSILMSGPTDFGKSGMTTIQSLIPGVEIRL